MKLRKKTNIRHFFCAFILFVLLFCFALFHNTASICNKMCETVLKGIFILPTTIITKGRVVKEFEYETR